MPEGRGIQAENVMTVLTPRFTFQNIFGVETASFSLSRGVQPGVCTVRLPANPDLNRGPGPMVWSDGIRTAVFQNCIVSDVDFSFTGDGGQVMVVAILDRRWRWQEYGQISGVYNVRTGAQIQEGTRRSVRQLFELVFQALGETNYNVSLVPQDVFPFVDWEMEKPATVLQELLREVNCHLALGWDDVIRIWPDGVGPDLPSVPSSSSGIGVEFGTRPGSVGVTSGWQKWQLDLELVPCGLNPDGRVQRLDELSFMLVKPVNDDDAFPLRGWELVDPLTMAGVKPEYRRQALESIWKWYRVRRVWSLPSTIGPDGKSYQQMPGVLTNNTEDSLVFSTRQFWPLLDHQLEVQKQTEAEQFLSGGSFDLEEPRRLPSVVWGRFKPATGEDGANVKTGDYNFDQWYDVNDPKNEVLLYKRPWQLEQERRLIVFSDPVYLTQGGTVRAPILRMRTAVNFRNAETRVPYRRAQTLSVGGPDGSIIEWTTREDLVPQWKQTGAGWQGEDNYAEINQGLGFYVQYSAAKYAQDRLPANMVVPWLELASPNGRIAQVTFEIDQEGFIGTMINRELESLQNPVSYRDRQRELLRIAQDDRARRMLSTNRQDTRKHGIP